MPPIESLLSDLAPILGTTDPVRIVGAWVLKKRRTYASQSQFGSGEGPFVEVVDWRWEGRVTGEACVAGIAFAGSTETPWYWAKSERAVAGAALSISVSSWAGEPSRFSFQGVFHGAYPPSQAVSAASEPEAACALAMEAIPLGRVHIAARLGEATLALLILPKDVLTVGRNGLWRLRELFAARLGSVSREIMTRRRTGCVTP